MRHLTEHSTEMPKDSKRDLLDEHDAELELPFQKMLVQRFQSTSILGWTEYYETVGEDFFRNLGQVL